MGKLSNGVVETSKNMDIVIKELMLDNNFNYLVNKEFDAVKTGSTFPINIPLKQQYASNPEDVCYGLITNLTLIQGYNMQFVLDLNYQQDITKEQIDTIKNLVINNLFLIHCVDKVIMYYKDNAISCLNNKLSFSTKNTYKNSWANLLYTEFYLEAAIPSISSNNIMKITVYFNNQDEIKYCDINNLKNKTVRIDFGTDDKPDAFGYVDIDSYTNLLKYINAALKAI